MRYHKVHCRYQQLLWWTVRAVLQLGPPSTCHDHQTKFPYSKNTDFKMFGCSFLFHSINCITDIVPSVPFLYNQIDSKIWCIFCNKLCRTIFVKKLFVHKIHKSDSQSIVILYSTVHVVCCQSCFKTTYYSAYAFKFLKTSRSSFSFMCIPLYMYVAYQTPVPLFRFLVIWNLIRIIQCSD